MVVLVTHTPCPNGKYICVHSLAIGLPAVALCTHAAFLGGVVPELDYYKNFKKV